MIIRAPRLVGHQCVPDLDTKGRMTLRYMGFGWLLVMSYIRANNMLLTVLAERWHSEHKTFHLPTREVTITLEDVYQILQVHSHGDVVRMIML